MAIESSQTHVNKYAEDVKNAIDNISDSLREISLKIHSRPELGYKEFFAHDILTDYLEAKGFRVTRSAYGIDTAFVAEYESSATSVAVATGKKVKAVGFCAEYDALPGLGHACGHNLISISSIAVAIGVKTVLEKYNLVGRVRLLGTPAEESTGGKIALLEKGAFDGLDACMMTHPAPVDIVYNSILSAATIKVEYFGKASHASASPWEGVNALDAIVTAYNGIALIRQQIPPNCRIHFIVTNGGQAPNIIPAYTSGQIIFRSTDLNDHAKLRDDVVKVLNAAAESNGCTIKLTSEMDYKPVPHNEILADRYAAYTEELGVKYPPRNVQETVASGSTDMGNVTHYIPGIHPIYNIASLDGEVDKTVLNHTIQFTEQSKTLVAHATAIRSSKGLALTAIDVLLEEGFSEAVRENFEKNVPTDGKAATTLKYIKDLTSVSLTGCGCH